ncbi:uncharacterized protein LOC132337619 [Haemorhous mexicanus]|uniref:uncharacterized protein LOC132337619 n=1 Tax=Haemorhous mexicanus TaxID=30427 RepID=UPI0028BD7656|nr:uncharacterized protein LOC132337619 [Haemorhous mexicanus]
MQRASFSRRGPRRGRGLCGGRCVTGRRFGAGSLPAPAHHPTGCHSNGAGPTGRGDPFPAGCRRGTCRGCGSGCSTPALRDPPHGAGPCQAVPGRPAGAPGHGPVLPGPRPLPARHPPLHCPLRLPQPALAHHQPLRLRPQVEGVPAAGERHGLARGGPGLLQRHPGALLRVHLQGGVCGALSLCLVSAPLPWGLSPVRACPTPWCLLDFGRCKTYNTVAVAVPREPVLYEFGGELIDRAARPRGVPLSPPWGSTGEGALPVDHHTRTAPKAGKKERKRKKDKKNKGKGLKKKGSSEKGARSHPAAAGPADPWALLPSLGEASNTILSDAPAREGVGREPVPATPSPVPTTSGKRRRKERNRKKRLKSKTKAEPTRELQL